LGNAKKTINDWALLIQKSDGHSIKGNIKERDQDCVVLLNQLRVWLQILQTDSITGTSTRTPTTVARAAPEEGPKSVMATATASSKKLLAPMRAPGAATL
jgi:hypothetical protein